MIACENVKSLTVPYLNGKLNKTITDQIEKHLEICPFCRMELKFDQQVYSSIISDEDISEISPDFNAVVMARVATLKSSRRSRIQIFISEHPWSVSVVGISASILFFIVFSIWNIKLFFNNIINLLFSPVPFLAALILLISFWIYYVNEKFIEKLIYFTGKNRAGH